MCELYGNLIRQRRKELGMRQAQLAEACNTSTAIVSNYERNLINHASLVIVRRFEIALGVPKGTFFS